MVSSLFCRMMILMLQQQQVNQQMQHQQNVSQYLHAPWWTDAAMSYWPPGPPEAGAMSKAKASPKEPAPVKPPAEGAGLGKGDGISSEPTAAEPAAAEPEPAAPAEPSAPEPEPAAPAEPAAPEPEPAAPAVALLPLLNQQQHLALPLQWKTGGFVGASSAEKTVIGAKAHALTRHAV